MFLVDKKKNILLTQSLSRGIENKSVPMNTNHESLSKPMLSLLGMRKDLRTFDRIGFFMTHAYPIGPLCGALSFSRDSAGSYKPFKTILSNLIY